MTGSQPTITEACQRAARVWVAGQYEREAEARRGGTDAVVALVAPGCSEAEKAELAQYWEQLQAQAAAEQAALKTA